VAARGHRIAVGDIVITRGQGSMTACTTCLSRARRRRS